MVEESSSENDSSDNNLITPSENASYTRANKGIHHIWKAQEKEIHALLSQKWTWKSKRRVVWQVQRALGSSCEIKGQRFSLWQGPCWLHQWKRPNAAIEILCWPPKVLSYSLDFGAERNITSCFGGQMWKVLWVVRICLFTLAHKTWGPQQWMTCNAFKHCI